MIYQVTANFFFSEEDEAKDFFHDCEVAFPKTSIINPDAENTELSTALLIENHHDESPNGNCDLIKDLGLTT